MDEKVGEHDYSGLVIGFIIITFLAVGIAEPWCFWLELMEVILKGTSEVSVWYLEFWRKSSVGHHFNLFHLIDMTGELKHRAVSSLITGAERVFPHLQQNLSSILLLPIPLQGRWYIKMNLKIWPTILLESQTEINVTLQSEVLYRIALLIFQSVFRLLNFSWRISRKFSAFFPCLVSLSSICNSFVA